MSSQDYVIERSYEYDPNDLIVAFHEVAIRRYGQDAFMGIKSGLLRRRAPLQFVSVKAGLEKRVMGIRGGLAIPKIPAHFIVAHEGPNIAVYNLKTENRNEVMEFLDAIGKQLDEHSIYRGQAIDSSLNFMDLSGVSIGDMVYNPKVLRDLKAHVWTMITEPELCEEVKIGRARKILFSGPFGCGKTMAALLTAKIAIANGYTFFYVRPTDKSGQGVVRNMIAFARRYQPSVVLIEDCDREQREGNVFEHGAIMAEIDGIKSKSNQMIVLMTTNYTDNISKGMLRPGRIDKEINFKVFTSEDMQHLLQKTIPEKWLSSEINWEEVTAACNSFTAAFVQEVGRAAMLLAISDGGPDATTIGTAVLVEAANDLRSQHDRSNAKLGF